MNNQVIFLDIDGPLLPGRQWFDPTNAKMRTELGSQWWTKINELPEFDEQIKFDPVAVQFFNLWSELSGADTVLATNWARWISRERLADIFLNNGLHLNIHEDWRTPKRFTSDRYNEIGMWMTDHPEYTGIIVDDDENVKYCERDFNDPEYQAEQLTKEDHDYWQKNLKFVAVEYSNGITMEGFQFGCKGLGIKQEVVLEHTFGIKPLTDEEKKQRDEDLELLIRCCI